MAPGRYEMRLNAHSTALGRGGSVFAPIEVPDFSRSSLVMSGLAIGLRPADGAARTDPFDGRLPVVPTTARDFDPNAPLAVSFRVQLGARAAAEPIIVEARLIDALDAVAFEKTESIAAEALDAGRGGQVTIDLPLTGLATGPYLLTVKATAVDGRTTRRDVVIRVR
jgi:hypothetical protein